MAVWLTIIVNRGLSHLTQKVKTKGCQIAIIIYRGLSHPTGMAALPSENISGCFFKGGETL
jgi:hypothetical protein